MTENVITVYGTRWCSDCFTVRRFFDKNNINYKWVDIDSDETGEEFVLITNKGMRSVPVILFNDGSIFVEPSNYELKRILELFLLQS